MQFESWIKEQELIESSIFGLDHKINEFTIVDRKYTEDDESLPTFMLANITPITTDIDYNLKRIRTIAKLAKSLKVNILVFPELPISGYVWEDKHEVNKHLRNCSNINIKVEKTIDYIRSIMDENSLELVILNNIREERDNLYDTTFVIKKNNNYNEEYYDKIFLTPIEKKYFKTGSDQRLIINSKWGKLGITICYDLCFTGLAEKYAYEDNVDAIINSAAWRRDSVREYPLLNYRIDNYYEYIWDLKHAALASHNQVWSIGCTCVGLFDRTNTYFAGGSGYWSPSGIPIFQGSKIYEELLILRNVDIRKHLRNQAKEDFNYELDYDSVWRKVKDIKPKII
jgi:predicted amidohydrolase